MIKPKKSLKDIAPYTSDRGGIDFASKKWVRLDWNEAVEHEPESVQKAVAQIIKERGLNFYPDIEAQELRAALSQYTNVSVENIIVHNGSDMALKIIFDAFLNPNDQVLIFAPTYTQILPFIATNGAHQTQFIPGNVFDPTEEEILSFLRESEKVFRAVYLNNPNNPTGILIRPAFIKELCDEFSDTLFIIDEAYYEFSEGNTCANFISETENIVVVRSFSKAFRLAGIRLGYSLTHPSINKEIRKIHNGKDINTLAQVAGRAALQDQDSLKKHVTKIGEAKNNLHNELNKLGVETHGTYGNYLVIKDVACQKIKSALYENGILIRDRSSLPKMNYCARLTISYSEDYNKKILSIIKEVKSR